ncbi:MAG: 2-amino-4-hydroxy-6-hydroxymethyldihydropteridine diphosphokinase [Nitrospirota bacterium]|nr:2-amino-4-hydroxy-6-hydroxymethyldihydropteridine diphosphokinase [Nitrospirota bacterium]
MSREIVYIGFGSNLGDRLDFCDRAVTLLGLLPHSQVTGVSSLYETEPLPEHSPGPSWFLNGIVRFETDLTPRSLLDVCREVEQSLGRDPDHRDGPRTLDLDILLYGTRVINEPGLIVPHPRLHLRRFVLEPLAELAPDLLHPLLNKTVRELLAQLTDRSAVRLLDPQPSSRYGSRSSCSPAAAARDSA